MRMTKNIDKLPNLRKLPKNAWNWNMLTKTTHTKLFLFFWFGSIFQDTLTSRSCTNALIKQWKNLEKNKSLINVLLKYWIYKLLFCWGGNYPKNYQNNICTFLKFTSSFMWTAPPPTSLTIPCLPKPRCLHLLTTVSPSNANMFS